ncbi:MAG: hypothetical protein ABEJ42_04750 [Halobacteriaceae archaeon]
MALVPAPRTALLVAATEVRRSWRRLAREGPYRTPKLILGAAFVATYALAAGAAGFFLGAAATAVDPGSGLTSLGVARSLVTGVFVMVVFFATQRSVKGKSVPDAADLLLTSTAARNVAAGLLAAEVARVVLVASAPVFAFASGVAMGSGHRAALPFVAATLFGVLAAGVAVGFALGLAVKNVAARSRFVANHRLAANLLATGALLGGYLVFMGDPGSVRRVGVALSDLPLGWPAEFALLAGPLAVDPVHAAVGGAGLVAVPAGTTLAAVALSRWLWYVDGVEGVTETERDPVVRLRENAVGAGLAGVARRALSRPARSVATKNVRRVVRAPYVAQYALLPVFFLFYEAQAFAVTRTVPARLPALLGVAGAWAAGALFTLNPIGNEEPVLPVTLTTAVSGRAFLAGLATAGVATVLPVTTVLVGVAGALSPLAPLQVGVVWVAATALCLVAPGIAAAAGTRFPCRHATTVARGRELRLPSPWAFLAYSVLLAGTAAPLVFAFSAAAEPAAAAAHLPASVLELGGAATAVMVAAVVGGVAYVDAAARLSGYRLD